MHTANLVVLLAASVTAQSTVTVLNLFWNPDKTLTLKGSDSTATTYEHVCAPSSNGDPSTVQNSSVIASSFTTSIIESTAVPKTIVTSDIVDSSGVATFLGGGTLELEPITAFPTGPAPTAKARLRRDDEDVCEPYILIQGASTWEFHLTDPIPGAMTIDGDCKWEGKFASATITCTATNNGSTIATFAPSQLSSFEAYQTVAVVSASTTQSGAITGTAAPTQSTGLAPLVPLPTGAMAFVGGAAGLFAAALAL